MNGPNGHTDLDRRIALDARDWIVRLTSGDVSEADLQRFKAWRDCSPKHLAAFERERTFWQDLKGLNQPIDISVATLNAVPARRRAVGRRGFLIGGAAAAATAALIAVPYLGQTRKPDFSTAIGEMADFTLPDGSTVMLNTDSAIAVSFQPNLRLVELLRGEAEFKVHQRAERFRVAALGGNSDTLEATFMVRSLDGEATVLATAGQVRVTGPASPHDASTNGDADIGMGQQTAYLLGETPRPPVAVDTEIALAWRKGRVIFEARSFSSAITELGRYVSERIVVRPGAVGNIPVSAVFSTHEAVSAIEALARTQGLTAHRIPGVVILIA